MLTNKSVLIGAVLAAVFASQANAVWYSSTVKRVLTDTRTDSNGNVNYGQCAVLMETAPSTVAPGCGAYVSFSCSGIYNTKSEGNAKYAVAQLAYVTGKSLVVDLDASKQHNGHCYAGSVYVQD